MGNPNVGPRTQELEKKKNRITELEKENKELRNKVKELESRYTTPTRICISKNKRFLDPGRVTTRTMVGAMAEATVVGMEEATAEELQEATTTQPLRGKRLQPTRRRRGSCCIQLCIISSRLA